MERQITDLEYSNTDATVEQVKAAIRAANLKIAIDCCNGVGAIYTKRFLKNLGVDEIIALNETPTGVFNHEVFL